MPRRHRSDEGEIATMTTTTARPAPDMVGARADEILHLIQDSDEYARLDESTRLYPDCWATFTGYPIIAQWDLSRDAGPLFQQALRLLALKSAVTGRLPTPITTSQP